MGSGSASVAILCVLTILARLLLLEVRDLLLNLFDLARHHQQMLLDLLDPALEVFHQADLIQHYPDAKEASGEAPEGAPVIGLPDGGDEECHQAPQLH